MVWVATFAVIHARREKKRWTPGLAAEIVCGRHPGPQRGKGHLRVRSGAAGLADRPTSRSSSSMTDRAIGPPRSCARRSPAYPRVEVLSKTNGGKWSALNAGLQLHRRRDRRHARRRHVLRARCLDDAAAPFRRPQGGGRGRQHHRGQSRQLAHAVPGAGVRHQPEPRPPRARARQRHHRRAGCDRRMAARRGAVDRRLRAGHAGRGCRRHHQPGARRLEGRVRAARGRAHRGARNPEGLHEPAPALDVRHAAGRLQAPRCDAARQAAGRSACSACPISSCSSSCSRWLRR